MASAVDLIIGVGWVVFWLYWIFMAAKAKPSVGSVGAAPRAIRLGILVIVFIVIKLAPRQWGTATQNVYLQGGGLVLFVAGLALAVWARVYLSDNWGMPMSRKQDAELVTTGPYKFIRHPIYSGVLLAMVGTAVGLTLYWLIVLVVVGSYFIWSAFAEEKYMLQQFPKVYPTYRQKTKMLVPFLF